MKKLSFLEVFHLHIYFCSLGPSIVFHAFSTFTGCLYVKTYHVIGLFRISALIQSTVRSWSSWTCRSVIATQCDFHYRIYSTISTLCLLLVLFVYMLAIHFLQDNLSVERAMDERTNRVGSSLSTLVYIVCASPVCEKKALFAFCQLTKVRNIETEKIRMVSICHLIV